MAIENKDYASFMVDTLETKNLKTGQIDKLDIDFTDTKNPHGKDAKGNPVSVPDIKELKSKIRAESLPENVKMPSLKDIKQYKSKTKTWGGKALRYKKGQKDGKGGQIMPIETQQAFRNIAKKEKISISKAINKYQNKNITKTQKNPVPYGQHDWQHKLKDIKNPNLLVNVKDSSGKIYRFTGTGKEIAKNPNFVLLKTRNLNRIYTAIKKRK